jgi:hypothetical protein
MHTQHMMQRVSTHGMGAEEWICPTCSRRLLIQIQPVFTKTVLDAGNEQVTHSAGMGSLQPVPTRLLPAEAGVTPEHGLGLGLDEADGVAGDSVTDDDEISVELLRPWLKALKQIEEEGFDEV